MYVEACLELLRDGGSIPPASMFFVGCLKKPTMNHVVEQQGVEERMGRVDVFGCFRVPREVVMKPSGGAEDFPCEKLDKPIEFAKSFEACLCRFLKVS
jgi:hypothetical protein